MKTDRNLLIEMAIDDVLTFSKDWSRHLINLEHESPEQLVAEINRKLYERNSKHKLVITDKGDGFYRHIQRPLRIPGTDMHWGWYRSVQVLNTLGTYCHNEETLCHKAENQNPQLDD